ncbi:hypothetical protein JB92DRAFT_3128716 [Gautieria morchelliformis]|nr:hypothetical protein JB92DRAFT_3128716 [Gautieria morchelliformis]
MVKWAFEHTNRKEYLAQMILWLTRQDKIRQRSLYFHWIDNDWSDNNIETGNIIGLQVENHDADDDDDEAIIQPDVVGDIEGVQSMSDITVRRLKAKGHMSHNKPSHAVARRPPFPWNDIYAIATMYQIPQLVKELVTFLLKQKMPDITIQRLNQLLQTTPLPDIWQNIAVWTQISIALPVVGVSDDTVERRAILARLKTAKSNIACFDTVLLDPHGEEGTEQVGLAGLRIAQVRLIFPASKDVTGKKKELPGGLPVPKLFAYVEWFSKPHPEPSKYIDMFEVKRLRDKNGEKQGGIVPIEWIVQPCPLVPRYPQGDVGQLDFDEYTCLEKYDRFFINSFHDQLTYQTVG